MAVWVVCEGNLFNCLHCHLCQAHRNACESETNERQNMWPSLFAAVVLSVSHTVIRRRTFITSAEICWIDHFSMELFSIICVEFALKLPKKLISTNRMHLKCKRRNNIHIICFVVNFEYGIEASNIVQLWTEQTPLERDDSWPTDDEKKNMSAHSAIDA